jgi:NarL family two-component system response regulator LiaR
LVPETIRVALENDYLIVLEGLRALLRPYEPQIRVVELDIKADPQAAVDVTLFDTYGEADEIRQRVRDLAADAANGAIIVFSFSDDAALAGTFLRASAQGFISKALPAEESSTASGRLHGASASCWYKHHHTRRCQPNSSGPAVMLVSRNGKANCWRSSLLV